MQIDQFSGFKLDNGDALFKGLSQLIAVTDRNVVRKIRRRLWLLHGPDQVANGSVGGTWGRGRGIVCDIENVPRCDWLIIQIKGGGFYSLLPIYE